MFARQGDRPWRPACIADQHGWGTPFHRSRVLAARQRLQRAIYRFSEQPNVKRDAKYYEQIRDAAAGGARAGAEGFARRTHPDFARFLDMARAWLTECQNHLLD